MSSMPAPAWLFFSFLGASAISGFLYEVSPLDPLTYGVVVMLLCAAAAVAAFVPARRAAHVDPAVALGAA